MTPLLLRRMKSGRYLAHLSPSTPLKFRQIQWHSLRQRNGNRLLSAGVVESFKRSKSFTLKIQDIVSEGSERGICTVYRCQVTSIDDVPVSISPLCLKLFDDRFQPLQSPDEDDELDDELLPRRFYPVVHGEAYALNEVFAYNKLLPAQGSVIPWFYGTPQFTLPDATFLSGLLMEYVEDGTSTPVLHRG